MYRQNTHAFDLRAGMLAVATVAVLVSCPFIGVTGIPFDAVFAPQADSVEAKIFWQVRLPRVCLAFLAGAALAAGGAVFQGIFRNYLATPFTLGVSSGAAFGAALYYHLGLSLQVFFFSGSSLFALGGALATVGFVYGVSRFRYELSTVGILLAGVVVNLFFSSLILFLQYVTDFAGLFRMTRWLMGNFEAVGFEAVWLMAPFVVLGLLGLFYFSRALDVLLIGDELATSRGLDVRSVRTGLFVVTSLMVGGVVSVCGPIGFVGIMVPHVCRFLIGSRHSLLLPLSALFGGALLVLCDTVARTVIAPYEIPVGVITALIGGPFFLWLLCFSRSTEY